MDHNKQTRAERNYLAGIQKDFNLNVTTGPDGELIVRAIPNVPEGGAGVWAAFWALSRYREERRPINPSLVLDWCKLYGARIPPLAAIMIDAMDRKFLSALSEEIAYNQSRLKK